MTVAADIANRHLLNAEGLAEKPLHAAQRVRIVVAKEWAASCAGQLLVSCLVNLLVRQIGIVSEIDIVAPETDSLISLPNGDISGPFPGCLKLIAEWAVKDRIRVSIRDEAEANVDVTVLVGTNANVRSGQALYAVGNGWKAWLGRPDFAPAEVVPNSSNPLGPYFAAALAAGEVFKNCRPPLNGRFIESDGYSLWSGRNATDWMSLEDGPEVAGAKLRPIHVIGAGAVGNGLAYVLANARLAEAYVVMIDDDKYTDTSLNRCFLAGWEDIDHPKVEAITSALLKSGIGAFPFEGTISKYLDGDRSGLRPDIERKVKDLAFDSVASCVDLGGSRQDIQGLSPTLLFGGSTLGLKARANFYPMRLGAACLACFNPREKNGDKLRELVTKLRGLDQAARWAYLDKEGIDPKLVDEYLSRPECGSLGEAAIRNLATRSVATFSVGFVSLGAALLLAPKSSNTCCSTTVSHAATCHRLIFAIAAWAIPSWEPTKAVNFVAKNDVSFTKRFNLFL